MTKTIFNLYESALDIMDKLVYIIIGVALIGFLLGVVRFVFSGSSEKLKTEGKNFMLYGILTLFVMTSLWSLVFILKATLDGPPTNNGDFNKNLDGEINIAGSRPRGTLLTNPNTDTNTNSVNDANILQQFEPFNY